MANTCMYVPLGMISVYKHSFCYSNVPTTGTKEPFVSAANKALVGTLITIGDVIDIFPIGTAILPVTSSIDINVPTRDPLAVETKSSFVLWLANLNNKTNLT